MQEQWIRWEPTKNLLGSYYFESISDNANEFKIVLFNEQNENKKIEIIFKDFVHSYRSTDDSYIGKIIITLAEQYGKKFYADWSFFKVINSSYVNWLSEQSYGLTKQENLTHFVFLGIDAMVDVIASYEPIIKVLENK